MSFIRPEATAALRRYGEPALYALVAGWGLWHGLRLLGDGNWFRAVPLALGIIALLGLAGAAERALVAWRGRTAGPGTVSIKEGQIAYFGPHGGAIMALDALVSVEIETSANGPAGEDLFWLLEDELGQKVAIPGSADGAVSLLDRLGTLPGFDHMAVVSAMGSSRDARFAVWRRQRQASLSTS